MNVYNTENQIQKQQRSTSQDDRIQSDDFWQSYEQKLKELKTINDSSGSIMNEKKAQDINESQKIEIPSNIQQDPIIEQDNIIKNDSLLKDHSQVEVSDQNNRKKIDIIDSGSSKDFSENVTNLKEEYEENEIDENDLPLFQQKKYLLMEMQISKDLKEQSSDNNKQEQIIENKDLYSKQQDRSVNKKQDIFNPKQEERDGRIIMDKNIKIYEEDKFDVSHFKYFQIKSKNPKADFNNPNNPNYKGRQTKLVQNLLKNQNILKKESEKEALIQKYENDIPNKSYKSQKQYPEKTYQSSIKDISTLNQQIDEKYNYQIFYQSNKSYMLNENISDEQIEEFQDKQRFKDQYVTDKYSEREEFTNRFYETRFKGHEYDRNQDFKRIQQKNENINDISDNEDYRYYQQKQGKGRTYGRQISIYDDYYKNQDDIYNNDIRYIKQRGRIYDQQDQNKINYQRDISKEDYLTGKDNDLDDSKDNIEYNDRDRQRFDKNYESKFSRDNNNRKYLQNNQKQHKFSYDEEHDISKDERQITEEQNEINKDRQSQYDHDMVMLMKRARGRAFQTSEQYKIRRGDKQDRFGRGERINNFFRGNTRGNGDYRFQRGRGQSYFNSQTEMFIFKPKDKDTNDYIKENNQKDQKNEQSSQYENNQKMNEIRRNQYEEEENVDKFQMNIENQIQQYQLKSEQEMKQNKQELEANENIEEDEDQKKKGINSIYETFKDVSSIFSNPLSFKTQESKQVKPRFFEDYDDGSDQENTKLKDKIIHQQLSNDKNNLNSVQLLGQSLFSQFGKGVWFNQNQQEQDEVEDKEENPQIIQYQNYEEDYEYLKYKNYDQQNEVGLSSSSLASLRKRALDPSVKELPQQMMQINNFNSQNKFMSLAALPVPKFIQEQQARQIQFQKMIDEEDSDL